MKRSESIRKFAKRLFPSPPESEIEAAGQRVLDRLHHEAPEDIAAFQLHSVPANLRRVDAISEVEHQILTAIYLLGGDCSDINIAEKVAELSSKSVARVLFLVCAGLSLMEKLGLVSGESRLDPEFKSQRRHYKLTEYGTRVLAEAVVIRPAVKELGDFA